MMTFFDASMIWSVVKFVVSARSSSATLANEIAIGIGVPPSSHTEFVVEVGGGSPMTFRTEEIRSHRNRPVVLVRFDSVVTRVHADVVRLVVVERDDSTFVRIPDVRVFVRHEVEGNAAFHLTEEF